MPTKVSLLAKGDYRLVFSHEILPLSRKVGWPSAGLESRVADKKVS